MHFVLFGILLFLSKQR